MQSAHSWLTHDIQLVQRYLSVLAIFLFQYSLVWEVAGAEFFQLLGLIFWTTDMVMNFVTGYVKDGSTELHLTAAAMNYLRSRFSLDVVVIFCDWAGFVASFFARNVRILRVIKTQRLLRIFRAGRMMHLINGFFDQLGNV